MSEEKSIEEPLEERLLFENDCEPFKAGDGLPAIRLMSEQERREEAAKEIRYLKQQIESLKKRNKDLYKMLKDSDQWE